VADGEEEEEEEEEEEAAAAAGEEPGGGAQKGSKKAELWSRRSLDVLQQVHGARNVLHVRVCASCVCVLSTFSSVLNTQAVLSTLPLCFPKITPTSNHTTGLQLSARDEILSSA